MLINIQAVRGNCTYSGKLQKTNPCSYLESIQIGCHAVYGASQSFGKVLRSLGPICEIKQNLRHEINENIQNTS